MKNQLWRSSQGLRVADDRRISGHVPEATKTQQNIQEKQILGPKYGQQMGSQMATPQQSETSLQSPNQLSPMISPLARQQVGPPSERPKQAQLCRGVVFLR